MDMGVFEFGRFWSFWGDTNALSLSPSPENCLLIYVPPPVDLLSPAGLPVCMQPMGWCKPFNAMLLCQHRKTMSAHQVPLYRHIWLLFLTENKNKTKEKQKKKPAPSTSPSVLVASTQNRLPCFNAFEPWALGSGGG